MNEKRCMLCGQNVEGVIEYHPRCSRKFFGGFPPPALDVSLSDLKQYAASSVLARISVTGAQKKLSLGIERKGNNSRFTIVGLWGDYILKPPAEEFLSLPENEDAVMRLAASIGIPVVPHGLIRLASGEIAFISRRVDREKSGDKIHMEDFCQISGRLTEDKYKGSLENIGKLIRRHSVYPGLDVIDFFERAVFCFIIGNADMHLKNFSLIQTPGGHRLSPAYDLLSTVLAIPEDTDESALTINGKKNKLSMADFATMATTLEIPEPAYLKIFSRFHQGIQRMQEIIKEGRLPLAMQERLSEVIEQRVVLFRRG